MRRLLAIVLILGLCGHCAAKPHQEDLERVKKTFLALRFNAQFSEELRGKSDLELFRLSCRENNVRFEETLELLQREEPEFYRTLRPEEASDGGAAPASP